MAEGINSFFLFIGYEGFPKNEIYGLSVQARCDLSRNMRRLQEDTKDKAKYNIAQGSIEECRYYLILAQDLKFADSTSELKQLEEVSKLLNTYTSSILNSVS
jgi:four helix bundle protein